MAEMCKYVYSVDHAEARYMAEMIALAPERVSKLFRIIPIERSAVHKNGHDAQFYWLNRGAAAPVFNEAAIVQVNNALADAVAEYAATRTAKHVPKWTFMFNPTCKEDLDVVAAIRASPPPVAIQFAVNINLPAGEKCVLFPGGGYWLEARSRLLLELQNAKVRCFPPRPAFMTALFTVVLDGRAVPVRQEVSKLMLSGVNIQDQRFSDSETVTTLWVKEKDTSYKVYYGDCAVLSQLCKSSTPPTPCAYYYRPDHDGARNLAEMIALAPTGVSSLFSVYSQADLPGYASFLTTVNEAALAAVKKALMDGVARATQHAEYTFYYDPACKWDLEAVKNLQLYPPNVAMHVACVKQEFDFDDDCSPTNASCFSGPGHLEPYLGTAARAKMAETLVSIKANLFRPFVPQPDFRCSMVVRSLAASPSGPERDMLDEILIVLRALPENTVHMRFYDVSNVVTTLWTDNGKHVWWGDAAVLGKLKQIALQLTKPSPYFFESVIKSLPPSAAFMPITAGFDGVRFQMFVKDKERTFFLEQLDTVPAVWRSRIAVIFVGNDAELTETCVHMWPPITGSLPRPTRYQDALAMLVSQK